MPTQLSISHSLKPWFTMLLRSRQTNKLLQKMLGTQLIILKTSSQWKGKD